MDAASRALAEAPPDDDRTWAVTVLGSLRETALIVEAALTGGYLPARG
jgi:hypothetical protein